LAARGIEAELVVVLAQPVAIDLRRVCGVAEDEADGARPDLAHLHAFAEARELLLGRIVALGVREDTQRDADLAEDALGDAVALLLHVAVDLDLVHEAQTAANVEAGADAALEGLAHPRRRGVLRPSRADARPEREARHHDGGDDHAESKIPVPIHQALAPRW